MYDNSRQPSVVLPLILSTVGSVLVGMVVRRMRGDRSAARTGAAGRGEGVGRSGRTRLARRNPRGPVL